MQNVPAPRLRRRTPQVLAVVAVLLACCVARGQVDEARIPKPDRTNVIVQMFNWKFEDIRNELPVLKDAGYTYVLVSPPQKSNPSGEWWGRYQPVDFTKIEGPLGDAAAFLKLNQDADAAGMKVLVDVVLNHMAEHPDHVTRQNGQVVALQYPFFATQDFHLPVVSSNDDRIHGWLGLPDLKTESRYVRDQAKNYLKMLVDEYHVDGFRFDAAKHIEDDFFEDVLLVVDRDKLFIFGEWVTSNPDDMWTYLDSMDAYDFPLAHTMQVAFAPGGDLRTLKDPGAGNGLALEGINAVPFVKNHDIAMNPNGWHEYRIGGQHGGVDEQLAYAYILGRRYGTPFVYVDKYKDPLVLAGVRFHDLALGTDQRWLVAEQGRLAWQRGTRQMAAINKHGQAWEPGDLRTSLEPGEYVELITRAVYTVDAAGTLGGFRLGGSSAAFLVKLLPQ